MPSFMWRIKDDAYALTIVFSDKGKDKYDRQSRFYCISGC